jgi:hypothetical protein
MLIPHGIGVGSREVSRSNYGIIEMTKGICRLLFARVATGSYHKNAEFIVPMLKSRIIVQQKLHKVQFSVEYCYHNSLPDK